MGVGGDLFGPEAVVVIQKKRQGRGVNEQASLILLVFILTYKKEVFFSKLNCSNKILIINIFSPNK